MKLRAIELKNVRRFVEPVRINGIEDGVNLLGAPNESGKSTVFDALNALFLIPHRSTANAVKQLKPHAGGAPEVTVELDTPDGRFVVSKRWLARREARVARAGTLIAQADEAEAWIARLLGDNGAGPAGLLWVRQGSARLDGGTTSEQQAALEARRDLLALVAGEVQAMTGGQRMDQLLARCREELAAYVTPTRRPRSGGPWADAQAVVAHLDQEQQRLADSVAALQQALSERRRLRQERDELQAPEAEAERASRLKQARTQLEAAQKHAAEVRAAEQRLQTETLAAASAHETLAALRRALAEQRTAKARADAARQALDAAQTGLRDSEHHFAVSVEAYQQADAARQTAEEQRRRIQAQQAALAGAARCKELGERLDQARAARQAVEEASAAASLGPTDRDMERLQTLATALRTARALRDSTATRIELHYAAGQQGRVMQDGVALEQDSAHLIHASTRLRLGDLGELWVHPGAGAGELADVEQARTRLSQALDALGLDSLDAAKRAHQAAQLAEHRRREASARLDALAPGGIAALEQEREQSLAAMPAGSNDDAAERPFMSMDEAEAAFRTAQTAADAATARREAARERRDQARTAQTQAQVRLEGAEERVANAAVALQPFTDTDEAALVRGAAEADCRRQTAEAHCAHCKAQAPDLDMAQAALTRAQSIQDSARNRASEIAQALATLDERIAANAGESVEERLQETQEQLQLARRRLHGIEREVAVLQRLETALEQARRNAREQYFEPVARELRPLMHLLWPDAVLNWTDASLLPRSLERNRQEESFDILSGGTQEQIALLVRLAFARLSANGGRHAPVILDDALVFTDDDRIERMFDALHRHANDLQIIVLSCRQRAFRNLGGKVLQIEAAG
ncbi:AAA family ATPase [Thiohalocapsa marina]|uniref:AAA family ATPase n=1 Tax=Thiohalocapsa marina TaxID=424902 RepID=UPI0036DA2F46